MIAKFLFDIELTPKQQEIVRTIAYTEHSRVTIACPTQWGKTFGVAAGVLIYLAFRKNKRVLLISPILEQTKIMRNYISNFIIASPMLENMLDIALTGLDRLKAEVSKQRLTFKNGCTLTILSAEGTGERLMGHGADLCILDETSLISDDVYRTRIIRMLGANPDSVLVEIGNPWSRDNHMYHHWIDPKWKKIHITDKIALQEGRITQPFLDEVKEEVSKMEYQILYKAEFPTEGIDSLFKFKDIQAATQLEADFPKDAKKIISCDVADRGMDRTVVMYGRESEGFYAIDEIFVEDTSENTEIAGRIVDLFRRHGADTINIDTIGVGVGVVSRVREVLEHEDVTVQACHFGEAAGAGTSSKADRVRARESDSPRKRFSNKKAEQYFRLKDLFEEGQISIPQDRKLIAELMIMTWDFTSNGKVKIVDPEKRDDYADALVYFTWKSTSEVYMAFGRIGR